MWFISQVPVSLSPSWISDHSLSTAVCRNHCLWIRSSLMWGTTIKRFNQVLVPSDKLSNNIPSAAFLQSFGLAEALRRNCCKTFLMRLSNLLIITTWNDGQGHSSAWCSCPYRTCAHFSTWRLPARLPRSLNPSLLSTGGSRWGGVAEKFLAQTIVLFFAGCNNSISKLSKVLRTLTSSWLSLQVKILVLKFLEFAHHIHAR